MVNGLTTLLDIVLEPTSQDMAEPILVSLLFLLNDPKSRYLIFKVLLREPFIISDYHFFVIIIKFIYNLYSMNVHVCE